ncbi:C2 family cysteine protease, partial [Buttiauxella gaviniae]|uniref:C2 family cysteine protease n=1 Tax=Buttiauxella gaviniae TaxID=82990 RepID=UPI0007E43D3F
IIASLDVSHIQTLGSDVLQSLNNDELLGISTSLSAQQRGTLTQSQLALLSTSASTGSALINGLSDTTLKNIMTATAADNTSLYDFETVEKVLKSFASSLTDPLTATQYGDLTSYVQTIGSVCGTDSSLYSIVNGMITGAGGASVQLATQEVGVFTRIGCLGVGSSATQFNQLITNWMDGTNAPCSSSTDDTVGRPLFADGGPTINDIHQGQDGDCSFLSALQGVVTTNPDFIKSMFVQNPNNTYSVRFFNNGVPTWVTVDNNVFVDGNSVASSSWVAIAERANVAYESTYSNLDNRYASLKGGFGKIQEITGDSYTSFWASRTTEDKWNTTDFELLKTAVLNGAPAQLSSWESTKDAVTGQTNFVHAHAFAIIGFDDATNDFVLTNPWGADRNDSSVAGTFEASMDQMWQHGNGSTGIAFANSNGASGAAGQLVTAMATMAAMPGASSDVTAALPANANTSLMAKPLV